MDHNFKVGYPVQTPDGRTGRILFFSGYTKNNGHVEPTEAVVLCGSRGYVYKLSTLISLELAEQPQLPGISTEIQGGD